MNENQDFDDFENAFRRIVGGAEKRNRKENAAGAADETWTLYSAFVDKGFTEEQAMQLLLTFIEIGVGKRG